MKKSLFQGLVVVALFFSTWFVLNQIDWMSIFKVEEITEKTKEKLGELFVEIIKDTEKENKNQYGLNSLDTIVNRICTRNDIDRNNVVVHVIEKDEVNAFALPNGHIVIYSGLILESDNQEELCGVICHEIAHIECNHVMEKLIKEIGLSTIISMTTGNGSIEIFHEAAKVLSSTAFDRKQEKEADIKAVEYLMNAKIDPEPFANFLYKLDDAENETLEYFSWINSHPDSQERAKYVMDYVEGSTIVYEQILTANTWSMLNAILE